MEVDALKEEFLMLGASEIPCTRFEIAVEDGFLEGIAVELLLETVAPASAPMLPDIDEGLLKEALLGIRVSPVGLRDETLCASAEGRWLALSTFACVKEGALEGRRPSTLFWISREGLCELEAEICCAREGLEELVGANVELLCDVLPSKDALGKRVSVVGLDEALLEAGPIRSLASTGAIVLIRAEFFLDVPP